jgi:Domain of unknown function (DUF6531)/RHS Repeat
MNWLRGMRRSSAVLGIVTRWVLLFLWALVWLPAQAIETAPPVKVWGTFGDVGVFETPEEVCIRSSGSSSVFVFTHVADVVLSGYQEGNQSLPRYQATCWGRRVSDGSATYSGYVYSSWFCPGWAYDPSTGGYNSKAWPWLNGRTALCERPDPPPHDDNSCGVSNPTLPGLGVKVQTETDYTSSGAAALEFSRAYRSRLGVYPQLDGYNGWRHNWQRQVLRDPWIDRVYAIRADSSVIRFSGSTVVNSQAKSWAVTAGPAHSLRELRDAGGTLTGWEFQDFNDDSVETYNAAGDLQSVKARNGWMTTLVYSDATTPMAIAPRAGLLISVKNAFGRELRLTYDAQGRLAELLPPGTVSGTGAGTASSAIRYAYDETASLGSGVVAKGQLTSVTWQDGKVRRYHYEGALHPTALTGITNEANVRYGTYSYDNDGRVTRTEGAAGSNRVDFSYTTNGAGQPTTYVLDYSSGSSNVTARTYTFTDIGNVRYPNAVTGPCTLCGNTAQSTTYDANGRKLRETGHDGKVTFYAYDSKGRETERATFAASYNATTTRPALNLAERVVSTKWHATWNLPTEMAEPGKYSTYSYGSGGRLTGQSWTATTDATGAAKFTAAKTGSTYATGWSYSASNLATTVVTKETDAGTTVAVETGRWTLAYGTSGDITKVTDAKVTPNAVGTITSYSASGQPLTGRKPDGRTFTYGYRADTKLSTLQMSDGYGVTYTYNTKGQLAEARATDGGLLVINYSADGKPLKYTANGEVVFDKTPSAPALSAGSVGFATLAPGAATQAASEAIPRPIPLPDIDWGDIGTRGRTIVGTCIRPVGVGLSLLLFSSDVGTCSTVDSRSKQECKKDPCEKELPTSDAARREALRRVGMPVGSSVPVASNLATPGYEQYVYWKVSTGKFVVLSHHPADGDHPCPHWHASNAYMTRDGSTQIADIELRRNGAFRYQNEGSLVVAHRNEQ